MWYSHVGTDEDYDVLGSDVMWIGMLAPVIWRRLLPSFSGQSKRITYLNEDEGSKVLQNVCLHKSANWCSKNTSSSDSPVAIIFIFALRCSYFVPLNTFKKFSPFS
jgi:hypothetical protein